MKNLALETQLDTCGSPSRRYGSNCHPFILFDGTVQPLGRRGLRWRCHVGEWTSRTDGRKGSTPCRAHSTRSLKLFYSRLVVSTRPRQPGDPGRTHLSISIISTPHIFWRKNKNRLFVLSRLNRAIRSPLGITSLPSFPSLCITRTSALPRANDA